jgi:hypothetical protein
MYNRYGRSAYPENGYEDAAEDFFKAGLYPMQIPGSRYLFRITPA